MSVQPPLPLNDIEVRLEQNARRLAALSQIGQLVTANLELEAILQCVIDEVEPLLGAEGMAILFRASPESLTFSAVSGQSSTRLRGAHIPITAGVAGEVMRSGQTVWLKDDPDNLIYRQVEAITDFHTRSLLAVPLRLKNEIIGVIEAVHRQADVFDQDDLILLEGAANWAAIAIENARQVAALHQRLRENNAISAINQALSETLDLDQLLQIIVDSARQIIPSVERAAIHLLSPDQNTLVLAALSGIAIPEGPVQKFHVGEGIAGRVLAQGQTINVGDILNDFRYLSFGAPSELDRLPPNGAEALLRSLMVAPIQSAALRLGTLSVRSASQDAFSLDDERLLTTLGVQAAVAIKNARLFEGEQGARQVAETLRRANQAFTQSLDLDTVLEQLLDYLGRLVPYDSASVMLLNEAGKLIIHGLRGYEKWGDPKTVRQVTFDVGQNRILNILCSQRQSILLSDIRQIPDWELRAEADHIRSWMGIPFTTGDKVIGLFSLDKTEVDFFTDEHRQLAEALSVPAALAVQNALLFESTQQRLREVDTLYKITQGITETLSIDDVLHQVVNLVQEFFGCYYVQAYLLDLPNQELVMQQGTGPVGLELKLENHRMAMGIGIVGQVGLFGYPFVTNDTERTSSQPAFYISHPLLNDTSAEMALPIKIGERVVGVLDIHHKDGLKFSDRDVRLMSTIANQVGAMLERINLYNDLQTALQHEKSARFQMVQSEKLAALGRITASVAHELNNPLQAIQNALYLVKSEEKLSQQAQEDLQVAISEAGRMAELIDRLRETYRPTTSLEFKPESLNVLIGEVQKLIGTHLRHNNVTFQFDPEPNLPPCAIMIDQIKQVVLNICLNAVEVMPNGGRITVKTRYQPGTRGVSIAISDDGPGIPDDILPYIFDPFFTTKDGGTGLGLAISYDIIQRHNGQIDVDTRPGKGVTFNLWLPLERTPGASPPLPARRR